MKSLLPLHEPRDAGPYPAMLVKTSFNDSQVMYWEPAKYVAKLRTLKTDDEPAAPQDEHGRRARRRLGPLRLPARGRLRLRVHPDPASGSRSEHARPLAATSAAAGWRATGDLRDAREPRDRGAAGPRGRRRASTARAALEFARDDGRTRAARAHLRGARRAAQGDVRRASPPTATSCSTSRSRTAATRASDAKFDVDGAIFTLSAYAEIGQALGDARVLADGEGVTLGRSPRFHGQHIAVPRQGVAVHINAFNFPAWGLAEKAAVALLAGMPVAQQARHQLGARRPPHDRDPGGEGRAARGRALAARGRRGRPARARRARRTWWPSRAPSDTGDEDPRRCRRVIRHSVRVNVEADSLNAAVLGPDAEPGGETYELLPEGRAARHDPEGRPEVHGHPPRARSRRRRSSACATTSADRLRGHRRSATPRRTACAWGRWPPRRSTGTCATGIAPPRRATAGSSSARRTA